MGRRLFQFALLLCGALVSGPRMAAAQEIPTQLRFRLGQFAQRVALAPLDSANMRRATRSITTTRTIQECPMPVAVPDLSKSERMPVARIDPAPYAIRQAAVGCVNPLGPNADTTAGRTAPRP